MLFEVRMEHDPIKWSVYVTSWKWLSRRGRHFTLVLIWDDAHEPTSTHTLISHVEGETASAKQTNAERSAGGSVRPFGSSTVNYRDLRRVHREIITHARMENLITTPFRPHVHRFGVHTTLACTRLGCCCCCSCLCCYGDLISTCIPLTGVCHFPLGECVVSFMFCGVAHSSLGATM